MRALLLAAGLGTRLRPITDSIPKCLVPIHGRPLLGYWFDLLFADGIDRALVNTHYRADAVNAYIAKSAWRRHVDTVHEPRLLGTAGTILQNAGWFAGAAFMVVHADNLSRFRVRDFIAAHARRPPQAAMTMMTFDTDAPTTCGIVELDSQGLVSAFHEKVPDPPGTRANAALYILEPEIVDYLQHLGREVIDFSTEVLPAFIGRIATFHNAQYHRDIGTIESLRKAEAEYTSA